MPKEVTSGEEARALPSEEMHARLEHAINSLLAEGAVKVVDDLVAITPLGKERLSSGETDWFRAIVLAELADEPHTLPS